MIYADKPHLYIFTGHFGSGKTEVSVNFALDLKRQKPEARVALVDMDIINPFFRSADAKKELEDAGIFVETMLYANTNVDAPALTGMMRYWIEDPTAYVILDIGGDDLGARACGYYAEQIAARPHTTYFVLNPYRPFTSTPEAALKIFSEVQDATLLPISEVLDNSNLLNFTDAETIREGGKKVASFAETVGLPVNCHCVMEKQTEARDAAAQLYPAGQLLLMKENVRLLFGRE